MSHKPSCLINRRRLLQASAASLALPFVSKARAQEKELKIYCRENSLPEEILNDFGKTTGVTVVQETYKTIDEMLSTMQSGKSGYDIVMQPGIMLPALVQADLYQPIIHTEYPSWAELNPDVLKLAQSWDPRNQYLVPYLWGATGMTYNLDQVQERLPQADLNSLDVIFKPDNAKALSGCGITILDSPTSVIPMAQRYLGKNGNSTNPDDYEAVVNLFRPIRPYISNFDNHDLINDLSNSEVCAANSWSSDAMTARQRGQNAGIEVNLRFVIPATGAPAWLLGWCIPKASLAQAEAKLFIGYMLQAEVLAKATNQTALANASLKAKGQVTAEIATNPAIYPSDETMKQLFAPRALTPDQEKAMQAVWRQIKGS